MDKTESEQTLLVVDDIPENVAVMDAILRNNYQIRVALNGEKALKIVSQNPPDLILLDIMMPGMSGYEVCRTLKENEKTKKIPVIFVTAKGEVADETKGFKLGAADYITKPVSPPIVRERVKTHLALYNQKRDLELMVEKRTLQLRKAFETIKNASLDTIHRLTMAAEYKDEDTGIHVLRMSCYAVAIARKMGFTEKKAEALLYAAPMHDIGKIGIPDRVLLKPGKLDADEWKIMKEHTVIGGKILEGAEGDFLKLGEAIAMTHHEKWDGAGYPRGIKGEEIPIEGRIVAISDVFDALTSKRPYKEPFSLEKTFGIIKDSRGSHFDPDVVDVFFDIEDEILEIKKQFVDHETSGYLEFFKGALKQ